MKGEKTRNPPERKRGEAGFGSHARERKKRERKKKEGNKRERKHLREKTQP